MDLPHISTIASKHDYRPVIFDLPPSELAIGDALKPLFLLIEASKVIRSAIGLGLHAIEGRMRHQDFDAVS